jgi:hypothetical protein
MPPDNQKALSDASSTADLGFEANGNANFPWVRHLIHHLTPHTAMHDSAIPESKASPQVVSEAKDKMSGFILANSCMSSNQSGETHFESAFSMETAIIPHQATT